MSESEVPTSSSNAAYAAGGNARGRAPARAPRKAVAARPKTARKPSAAAKRKSTARLRPAARRGGELQGLLQSLARRASDARSRFASASGDSAQATRRAWQKVSGASRKTIDRLAAEWKGMDSAKKTQVLAALLTALAAASAPIVRRGLKKR
jgi:hypothetical protein